MKIEMRGSGPVLPIGEMVRVLNALDAAGCEVWVAGGWGIDVLVGRVTRDHHDLDLLHRVEQERLVIAELESLGYAERPGAVPGRPARFVMTDGRGHELDLHPLHIGEDGSAVQHLDDRGAALHYPAAVFVTGTIEGVRVRCLSVDQQVAFHQGYEPRDRDLHDMASLRAEFGVTTHF